MRTERERDALLKVKMMEDRLWKREKEIDEALQSGSSFRKEYVEGLESLLNTERAAHSNAKNRADNISLQLQNTQGKLDQVSQELNALKFSSEKMTLDGGSKLRTAFHATKRGRTDDYEIGADSVHGMGANSESYAGNKRSKSTTSPLKFNSPEDGGSVFRGDEQTTSQQTSSEDYTRFTVQKLKQELTNHNFGAELLQLKNPNKRRIYWLCTRNAF